MQELALIRPQVVAGVGERAWKALTEVVSRQLTFRPALHRIIHDAYRGDPWPRWEREFPALLALL